LATSSFFWEGVLAAAMKLEGSSSQARISPHLKATMFSDIFSGSGKVRDFIFRHKVVEENGMTLKAIKSLSRIRASLDKSSKLFIRGVGVLFGMGLLPL
tara:strand:+ start:60 stop:356 length:297 start_codon:yes stop_codon:yes gene_type:complete